MSGKYEFVKYSAESDSYAQCLFTPKQKSADESKLFVANLGYNVRWFHCTETKFTKLVLQTTQQDLEDIFRKFGEVQEVRIAG